MLFRNYSYFRKPCPVESHVHGDGVLNVIGLICPDWVFVGQMLVYSEIQGVQCEKFLLHFMCESMYVTVVCQLECLLVPRCLLGHLSYSLSGNIWQ